MKKENKNPIIIYQGKSGAIELKGDFQKETIWATQAQIVDIFSIDQSVISRHIKNIFKDGEIEAKSNMQKMHIANSDKPVVFYSLDVLLAVGYRTNSKIAISFRQWVTKILRNYIIDGFAINEKRLRENNQIKLSELKDAIGLLQTATQNKKISKNEALGLLQVITNYTNSWLMLHDYDKGKIKVKGSRKASFFFKYEWSKLLPT